MSRLLPRYQAQDPILHNPLDELLAQREAEREKARAAVLAGHTPDADPQDLRGIPCIARGVQGTSPHTNPLSAVLAAEARALRPTRRP